MNRTGKSKKASPIGCIILLIISALAFTFLPWQVAVGFLLVFFVLSLLFSGIARDIRQIRRRNLTQKSLISQVRDGYVELVGRIKPSDDSISTWLASAPADFRWVSFQHFYRPKNRTQHNPGHWSSFFDTNSDLKYLTVSDGSGTAFIALHMADFRIKRKSRHFSPSELLKRLQESPIEGFDYSKLKKDKKVKVTEHWVPGGQSLYFYGNLIRFEERLPEAVMERISTVRTGGGDLNDARKLLPPDFEQLRERARTHGESAAKLMLPDYGQDPAEGVIISYRGDRRVNLMSYLSIVGLSFGIVFVLFIGIFLLSEEYPELLNRIVSFVTGK